MRFTYETDAVIDSDFTAYLDALCKAGKAVAMQEVKFSDSSDLSNRLKLENGQYACAWKQTANKKQLVDMCKQLGIQANMSETKEELIKKFDAHQRKVKKEQKEIKP